MKVSVKFVLSLVLVLSKEDPIDDAANHKVEPVGVQDVENEVKDSYDVSHPHRPK